MGVRENGKYSSRRAFLISTVIVAFFSVNQALSAINCTTECKEVYGRFRLKIGLKELIGVSVGLHNSLAYFARHPIARRDLVSMFKTTKPYAEVKEGIEEPDSMIFISSTIPVGSFEVTCLDSCAYLAVAARNILGTKVLSPLLANFYDSRVEDLACFLNNWTPRQLRCALAKKGSTLQVKLSDNKLSKVYENLDL